MKTLLAVLLKLNVKWSLNTQLTAWPLLPSVKVSLLHTDLGQCATSRPSRHFFFYSIVSIKVHSIDFTVSHVRNLEAEVLNVQSAGHIRPMNRTFLTCKMILLIFLIQNHGNHFSIKFVFKTLMCFPAEAPPNNHHLKRKRGCTDNIAKM